MKLEISVPDSYTGDIIGDLNTKRARILGMNPADGVTLIQAEAPQSEVQRYATELRSHDPRTRQFHHGGRPF